MLIEWIPSIPVPCLLIEKSTGLIIKASPSALTLGYIENTTLSKECFELVSNKSKSELIKDNRYWSLDISDTDQGLLVIATEITKQVDESQKIIDKLHNKEYFMGRLLRHDLTSPLATISYLLSKAESRNDKAALAKAIQSVNRITSLVERSGYLFGKGGGHKEKFRAVDVIKECIDDLELNINKAQAKIEVIGNGTMIYGEIVRLRQVFLNLIGNAIKFKSQTRDLQITITVRKLDKITSVEVKDNGIGISKVFFEDIFAPAKKLHSRVEFEGEGLGLAIAKEIIEEHLGKITIHSEIDVGTTFTVWLPYHENPPTTIN